MSKFFYIFALFIFFSCQNSPTSSTSDCGLFYGEGSILDCLDSSDGGGSGNINIEDCLGIPNGSAVVDCFGVCDGGAILDCAGQCNGSAQINDGDCVISQTLLENFSNISDWEISVQCGSSSNWAWVDECDVNYGGWQSYSNGYIGNCVLSESGSFGYGNRITKTFTFPSDGKITFWYTRGPFENVNSNSSLYLYINGEQVWSDIDSPWTKGTAYVNQGVNIISFSQEFAGEILLDHLEYFEIVD